MRALIAGLCIKISIHHNQKIKRKVRGKNVIRTKTHIFIQRLNLEMQSLREYAALLERWNEDDNQDEVLQEAELDVIDRIGSTLKEMRELQSHEWSVMYKALQDSAEKNAADGSGMPKEGPNMPKDVACKEAE